MMSVSGSLLNFRLSNVGWSVYSLDPLHERVRQMIKQGKVPLLPDHLVLDGRALDKNVQCLKDLDDDQLCTLRSRYQELYALQQNLKIAAQENQDERSFKSFCLLANFGMATLFGYGAVVTARQESLGITVGAAALGLTALAAGVQAGRARCQLKNAWLDSVRKGTPFLIAREVLEVLQVEVEKRQQAHSTSRRRDNKLPQNTP